MDATLSSRNTTRIERINEQFITLEMECKRPSRVAEGVEAHYLVLLCGGAWSRGF